MGIRMQGLSGGFDPKMVDQLVQLEKIPVEQAKQRKEKVVIERKEVLKLTSMLSELDGTLNSLKNYTDFAKMKVESSHPDIIDGIVKSSALPGSYEFEVRGMARSEKELAYGFPDKTSTDVGFGYMYIEREDLEPLEVEIEPGSTLDQVAQKINDANGGVKALVVNTKYQPDPYRLLVVSEKSGKESRINIDPDTTFMEFKEQVTGRNLDLLFEDVPITDETNTLAELIDGVVFNVHRAEPGTRVQVNIAFDLEKTVEGIKAFVDKYNAVSDFVNNQFKQDPETKKAGILSGDGSIKTVMRSLQSALVQIPTTSSKYNSLADIGITTNPKTGTLVMDEAKVRQALAEDYVGVSRIFTRNRDSSGVADRLATQLKGIRDPEFGTMKSRERGLDNVIKNQDKEIEQKEENMKKREEMIRHKFTALDGQLSGLKAQGDFLNQRFGAQGGGGGAG